MTFLIVSASALMFTLLLLIFYGSAKRSDNKHKRLASIGGSGKSELDEDLEQPFFQRVILPMLTSALRYLSNLMPKNKGTSGLKTERTLKMAGLKFTTAEYNAARLMFTAGCVLAALIVSPFLDIDIMIKVLLVFMSFLISSAFPGFYLKHRINSRQEEITHQLPDVMDLLNVSIEAGLGFDSALVKIGERLQGLLVDELNQVLTEIHLGRPRREALKNFADRSSIEELKTFLSAVVQAEQLGIPIKNVLQTQSAQLRTTRRQKAEEKAMKAPVKMLIPLVGLVFPVLFIILLGPTVIKLIEQM